VRWDESLIVVPNLAESWDVSDDGLIYTFYLRQGVNFHNGEELTAEDVVYSFERLANPEVSMWASDLNVMESVEAVDDYTVQFTLQEEYGAFLDVLSNWAFIMYPKDFVPEGNNFVSTGPFMIEKVTAGEEIVVVRNPDYWGAGDEGLPYLDRVVFNNIQDELARTVALVSGQSDVVYAAAPQMKPHITDQPDFEIVPGWVHYKGIALSTFNVPAFANPLVREAINVAINRGELIELVHEGIGEPILGDSEAPHVWCHLDENFLPLEGDLERAKALLKEAGYADGFSFKLATFGDWPPEIKAGQILQDTFKQLNIDMQLEQVEPALFITRVYEMEVDAAFVGYGYSHCDRDFRQALHPTDAIVHSLWDNETIGTMIDEAAKPADQAVRKQLYAELTEALFASGEDTYTVFLNLWRSPLDMAMNMKRVRGFEFDGSGAFRSLRQVWVSD